MRKLLPKVSNVFARYPSSQSCGNILLPFLGKPHLKINLILLFFLYQKEDSSKWRKWKDHYILEESKKDQSICVSSPNILEYIPKHRKQFEMDPNIIPSQIPTRVNKICLREVSCLREGKENTGIAKKDSDPGKKMWIWQKAHRPSYIENGFRKFLTRPQPPKKGSQHSQKGDYFLRFWNHPGLVYHSGQ